VYIVFLPPANLPPQPGVEEGEVCLLRGEEDAGMDGGAHGLLHPPELGAHRRPLDIVRATLALQPAVPDVALGVHGDVAFRTSVRRDADELGHGHHLVSFFFRSLVGQAGRESTSAVGRAERATCAYCVGVRRRARFGSAIIPSDGDRALLHPQHHRRDVGGALAVLVAVVLFSLTRVDDAINAGKSIMEQYTQIITRNAVGKSSGRSTPRGCSSILKARAARVAFCM